MLKGYKTYIISAIAGIYAVSAYLTGHMDFDILLQFLQVSGVASSIRSAVSNISA